MHFRDVNIILFTTKLCVYCQNFRWNILLRDLLAVRIGRIERQWPLSFSNTNFMRDILPRTPCAQPNLLGQFPTLGNVTPETWSMINRAYVINDQPRIRDQWSTAHTWSMINRAYVINDHPASVLNFNFKAKEWNQSNKAIFRRIQCRVRKTNKVEERFHLC
jgi:hypothetical protein